MRIGKYGNIGIIILCVFLSAHASAQADPSAGSNAALFLENAFNNLDLLWELQNVASDEYAAAHNLFVTASQGVPDLVLFPLAMPMSLSAVCVKYQLLQHQLVATEECALVPLIASDTTPAYASYTMSRSLLTAYYLDTFQDRTQRLFHELQIAVQKEPDSALADFMPKLREILTYAESLQSNPLLIDVAHIIQTQSTITDTEILVQLESRIRQTLKNDMSFASGTYQLEDFSEKGQDAIHAFVQRLIEIKQNYPLQYPGQPLIIKIKTVGYTDEIPVTRMKLISQLLEGIDIETLPTNSIERQSFLNRRLSEFRAATVNQYMQEQLRQTDISDELEIVAETVGKGGEFPSKATVSPPYLKRDPRRRICKISVTFTRKPLPTLFKAARP